MRFVLLALLAATSTLAQAQAYKCRDAQGRISYSSNPCPPGQQPQGAPLQSAAPAPSGNPDTASGLWETVLVANPRASHPKQNPRPSAAELKAMGEMGYMFGRPLKTLRCGTSPVKEFLSRHPLSYECRRQIESRSGTCTYEKNMPGGTGILSNKEAYTVSGNYRDSLDVTTRFIRVYQDNPSDPVVDESRASIRFLGACRSGMKPGEEYHVNEDGSLKPAR